MLESKYILVSIATIVLVITLILVKTGLVRSAKPTHPKAFIIAIMTCLIASASAIINSHFVCKTEIEEREFVSGGGTAHSCASAILGASSLGSFIGAPIGAFAGPTGMLVGGLVGIFGTVAYTVANNPNCKAAV